MSKRKSDIKHSASHKSSKEDSSKEEKQDSLLSTVDDLILILIIITGVIVMFFGIFFTIAGLKLRELQLVVPALFCLLVGFGVVTFGGKKFKIKKV